GGPNTGKSRLLRALTRATPEVAPYPFTTREPIPGMMEWQDVKVQLIDLPPITAAFMEGYVSSMVRSPAAAPLLVHLADDDGPFVAEAALQRLADTKTLLGGEYPETMDDPTVEFVKTMLVANKIDADGAADRLEICKEMFGPRFPIHVVSAEHGSG